MYNTITGVDLAKKEIQVCLSKNQKVLSNKAMTPSDFNLWLAESKPMTIIFEACATSNYWKQKALEHGHDARLVSTRLVANIRQNQKTDKNDALAVLQASQLIDIAFINGKSRAQQELQALVRLRELAVKQKTSLTNQLNALLLEFNIHTSPRKGGLKGAISDLLEDADNDFSFHFRAALNAAWAQLVCVIETIKKYDSEIEKAVIQHTECNKLLALEGVGVINAVNLYIALGCNEVGTFKTGRDASACIGLTPIQHSSGGKVKLGSIGKHIRNTDLRSTLVTGAMAVIRQVVKREAKTTKEKWIQELD